MNESYKCVTNNNGDKSMQVVDTMYKLMMLILGSIDKKVNESYEDYDVDDIEDIFLEYIDKWNMKDDNIVELTSSDNITYYIKKSNVLKSFLLMVTCRKELSKVDKSELVSDMKSFISRLNKMGFEVKWNNKHNPENFINGFDSYGGQYTNRLGIYIISSEDYIDALSPVFYQP